MPNPFKRDKFDEFTIMTAWNGVAFKKHDDTPGGLRILCMPIPRFELHAEKISKRHRNYPFIKEVLETIVTVRELQKTDQPIDDLPNVSLKIAAFDFDT